MRPVCRCGDLDCGYRDFEEEWARVPDAMKPKTGGIVASCAVFGAIVAFIEWYFLWSKVAYISQMIAISGVSFGVIFAMGYIVAYSIREKAGAKAKAIMCLMPFSALLVLGYSMFTTIDPELSVNAENRKQFDHDIQLPQIAAYDFMGEIVATIDNPDGDYRVNGSDTDGIDSRSYVCSPDVDEAARDTVRTEGAGAERDQLAQEGREAWLGDVGWRGQDPPEGSGDPREILIDVAVELAGTTGLRFSYGVEMSSDGDAWCVSGVRWIDWDTE